MDRRWLENAVEDHPVEKLERFRILLDLHSYYRTFPTVDNKVSHLVRV
jgi:hypothetical protein